MIHAGGVDYLSAYYGENEVLRLYIGDFLMWEGLIPVSFDFDGVTTDGLSGAVEGESYTAVLAGTSGNKVQESSVIVTMGGVDITSTAYDHSTKTVTIAEVTGAISITAVGRPYDAEVAYIEANGTQYIDTGYMPNYNTKIEIKGRYTYSSMTGSNSMHYLFGARDKANILYFDYLWNYYRVSSKNHYDTAPDFGNISGQYFYEDKRNTDIVVVQSKDGCYVDGTKKLDYSNASQFSIDYSLYLLWCNISDGSETSRTPYARMYYAKIWDNDILVRDYIPVRNNGVGYLYDKVSGQLFGNAGTGDFTYGNDITT